MKETKSIQQAAIRIVELIAEEKRINQMLVEVKTELSFLSDSFEKDYPETNDKYNLSKKRPLTVAESFNMFFNTTIDITGCNDDCIPFCELWDGYKEFCDKSGISARIKNRLSFSKMITILLPESNKTLIRMGKYDRKLIHIRTGIMWKE